MKTELLILLFLTASFTTPAKTKNSKISLNFGYISNYQSSLDSTNELTFSPEIKIGGIFMKKFLEWDFSISYWNDGIDEPFNIRQAASYSHSSIILGLRLSYYPPYDYIPIHFIAGISSRFVNEKYLGGSDINGSHRSSNSFVIYTFDFGAGMEYKINDMFRITCDALFFMPFKKKETLPDKGWGGSLKIGIDYFYK